MDIGLLVDVRISDICRTLILVFTYKLRPEGKFRFLFNSSTKILDQSKWRNDHHTTNIHRHNHPVNSPVNNLYKTTINRKIGYNIHSSEHRYHPPDCMHRQVETSKLIPNIYFHPTPHMKSKNFLTSRIEIPITRDC